MARLGWLFIAPFDHLYSMPQRVRLPLAAFQELVLSLVRALLSDGRSRFQPYLDSLPGRDAVLNCCNFPPQYASMLQMEVW